MSDINEKLAKLYQNAEKLVEEIGVEVPEKDEKDLHKLLHKLHKKTMELAKKIKKEEKPVYRMGAKKSVKSVKKSTKKSVKKTVKKTSKKSTKRGAYTNFVKKHMHDKDLAHLPVTERMSKIAKMWRESK